MPTEPETTRLMSDHEQGMDSISDRRGPERRMSTDELLVRLDERVATLIERIDSFTPTLEEMRHDIQRNTERSLANMHDTRRHDSMIQWTIRAVLVVVIGAVLLAAGIGIPPVV